MSSASSSSFSSSVMYERQRLMAFSWRSSRAIWFLFYFIKSFSSFFQPLQEFQESFSTCSFATIGSATGALYFGATLASTAFFWFLLPFWLFWVTCLGLAYSPQCFSNSVRQEICVLQSLPLKVTWQSMQMNDAGLHLPKACFSVCFFLSVASQYEQTKVTILLKYNNYPQPLSIYNIEDHNSEEYEMGVYCLFFRQGKVCTYNFNSEVQMLRKIFNKRLMPQRSVVYFFSKDPFERFNRKKDKKDDLQDEDGKAKSHLKGKIGRNERGNAVKPEEKNRKKEESTKNQEQRQKQQQEEPSHQGAFQKFNSKRYPNPKNADNKEKEIEQPQQKEKSTENVEKEHKGKERDGQQSEQPQKRQSQSRFSQEEPGTTLKGFQKFNRGRIQKQSKAKSSKQQTSQKTEARNEATKSQQSKKSQIPTEHINLNEGENPPKETTVLRKTRGLLNKKHNQDKLSESINQLNQEPEPQEPPKPEMNEQPNNEQQKWEEFEREKDKIKAKHKKNLPRYERLNLLKEPEDAKEKGKKEQPKESAEPVNHKKNLAKLLIAGVGLMLLSNNEYFTWNNGKKVEPEYFRTALEEDRIEQTWIQNTEVDLHNQESIKGRNIESHIYIREKNGDVAFCVSNQEFQNVWLSLVSKHNETIEKKGAELYPMGSANEALSRGLQPVRKIAIGANHEHKKSSLVADVRSILSIVLLYFFIKSIMDVSKGAKGKGGKGATGLFENEKSHRFKEVLKITFQDVVGMQKAKDEIVEFIDFLKHPDKYNRLGARIPKGALLTGPPGTGKTMIAKACAGESKVPFFTISGSEFIEMYVGVGAQRVRNLFKQAKESAPSIIFIDEIDAVGKKRSGLGGGGNDERDTTLNQLLVEMDGFDTNTNVIVFAATNQKEVLDPALTRPGRFDRLIEVDLPDLEGRREIFGVHLKPLVLDRNIDIKEYAKRLATLTPGFSGADIKNVCNEAAIIAARNNKELVSIMDFELATERIIGGVEKKSQLITPETRRTVAYHECGHGVVSWFIENSNPLLKLTIIPRSKGALGFAQYLPNEQQMFTKVKLLDEICVILGGRISEEIFFGKISTGASDDLNKAYQIAKSYVTELGFGEKLGWIRYQQTEYAKEYSKEVENKIDSQILEIMRVCSQKTRAIVNEKKDLIHKLAEKLLEIETIDQTIIQGILGPRPFAISKQHSEYIKQKKRISEQILGAGVKKEESAEVKMKRSDYIL